MERTLGTVCIVEKFHKAVADHGAETGVPCTESILFAHQCKTQIIPRLLSEVGKTRNANSNLNNERIIKEVSKRHAAIMKTANPLIATTPHLQQVSTSIAEMLEINEEASDGNTQSQRPRHTIDNTPALMPTERNEIQRSPFIYRGRA
jgi:hypothetical protein